MSEVLLEAQHLACSFNGDNKYIFHDIDLKVNTGDVLVLQGRSGCGKSTLLKCLAHLNVYEGEVFYRGKKPVDYGVPAYRTHVLYVPQRPSLLPGTPRDFLKRISSFSVWRSRQKERGRDTKLDPITSLKPIEIGENWGIDEELWDRKWTELSGGESQRISMAAAVGADIAEILLLDEPTSALDAESASKVEQSLASEVEAPDSTLKAIIWITHSPEQGRRVGNRFVSIVEGRCQEDHNHDQLNGEA